MKQSIVAFAALALLSGLGACTQHAPTEPPADAPTAKSESATPEPLPPGAVARVNGEVITEAELVGTINSSPVSGIDLASPAGRQLLQRLTTAMIQSRLLEAEAKAEGLASDETYLDAVKQFAAGLGQAPNHEQLVAEFRRTKLVAMQRQRLRERFTPDEEQVRAYFADHRQRYDIPDSANLQQIVVADAALAEQVARLARNGDSFERLALAHSTDPYVQRNFGSLGWVKRGAGIPALDAVVFALTEKGEIGGPVQTDRGYHVVKLLDRKEGRRVAFEEMAAKVADDMVAEALDRHLVSLAEQAVVTVDQAFFAGAE
jgi:parvulin-like peptidyl-prolyl isomerase